jgi:hypothetical protein
MTDPSACSKRTFCGLDERARRRRLNSNPLGAELLDKSDARQLRRLNFFSNSG